MRFLLITFLQLTNNIIPKTCIFIYEKSRNTNTHKYNNNYKRAYGRGNGALCLRLQDLNVKIISHYNI